MNKTRFRHPDQPMNPPRGIGSMTSLLAGLVLAALAGSDGGPLAGIIDDFNNATPAYDGWNPPVAPSEPPAVAEVVGQQLRIAANFTTATTLASPFDHFCNVYYRRALPVRQGQTLELRTDVIPFGADNVFGCLVTVDLNGGETWAT